MTWFDVIARLRRAAGALAALAGVWVLLAPLLAAPGTSSLAAPGTGSEVRALWVLRSSLTTPAGISTLVRTARDGGFNTLLVQVRGRGDAYYTSSLEPRAADLVRQPESFDPLATVIASAHAAGLRVHAWMDLDLVSSAVEMPTARTHIVYQHPEWLMVPRAIAQDLATVDPTNPAYVGKLARWTRGQSELIEGLYASPIDPDAAQHTIAVVADVATRYDVDGIHLDYARYPNDQFDYSRYAIAEFTTAVRPSLAPGVRAAADIAAADDLFAYPDRFPDAWKAFRQDRLTDMVSGIRAAVRAARPSAMLTTAVVPDPTEASDVRLQNWRAWLQSGTIDAVCPMAYAQEPARFAEQIASARGGAGDGVVWAGIGAYRLTPAQTIENIQAARRMGAAGFVLFSYDSLTGPTPPAPDYLAAVGRAMTNSRQ